MRRLLALAVIALALAPGPAPAGGAPALDDDLKRELAALPRLRGKALAAGGLDGKVVIVAFFASWCPPCVAEFRHLNEIDAAYRDRGVETVAVNVFETFGGFSNEERLASFLDRFAPEFAVVAGSDSISAAFGTIRRIPTLFVFDREGRASFAFVHKRGATKRSVGADELRAVLATLL